VFGYFIDIPFGEWCYSRNLIAKKNQSAKSDINPLKCPHITWGLFLHIKRGILLFRPQGVL
jgi:hypothetical protein